MLGSFHDSPTVEEFTKRCGILTVEIEHVDVATLEKLEHQGVDCQPKASTVRIIQDKYLQKVHFSRHGIPLPEFLQIDDLESAKRAGGLFGYPLMIKSRRLAYDGRGNAVAKSEKELSAAVTSKTFTTEAATIQIVGMLHNLFVQLSRTMKCCLILFLKLQKNLNFLLQFCMLLFWRCGCV
ncbi:phosphoribosylaminoimidazole carboxylase putative / AIR carboxylase putative [Euphorbia peplus]|nr:phosphoribosylaminoimidazole carboxylase putative / AIR carboxylase putative [Euphorbia peplus]